MATWEQYTASLRAIYPQRNERPRPSWADRAFPAPVDIVELSDEDFEEVIELNEADIIAAE